jgi:hypothetical protein
MMFWKKKPLPKKTFSVIFPSGVILIGEMKNFYDVWRVLGNMQKSDGKPMFIFRENENVRDNRKSVQS